MLEGRSFDPQARIAYLYLIISEFPEDFPDEDKHIIFVLLSCQEKRYLTHTAYTKRQRLDYAFVQS